jgi:hypothetical protein
MQTTQRVAPMGQRAGGMYQAPGAGASIVDARDEEEGSGDAEYDDARSEVGDERARLV